MGAGRRRSRQRGEHSRDSSVHVPIHSPHSIPKNRGPKGTRASSHAKGNGGQPRPQTGPERNTQGHRGHKWREGKGQPGAISPEQGGSSRNQRRGNMHRGQRRSNMQRAKRGRGKTQGGQQRGGNHHQGTPMQQPGRGRGQIQCYVITCK